MKKCKCGGVSEAASMMTWLGLLHGCTGQQVCTGGSCYFSVINMLHRTSAQRACVVVSAAQSVFEVSALVRGHAREARVRLPAQAGECRGGRHQPWWCFRGSKCVDLAWAAAWLYSFAGTSAYLSEAELFYKLHLQHEARLSEAAGWIPSIDNMGFAAGGL
jgi:hypothetical protein